MKHCDPNQWKGQDLTHRFLNANCDSCDDCLGYKLMKDAIDTFVIGRDQVSSEAATAQLIHVMVHGWPKSKGTLLALLTPF